MGLDGYDDDRRPSTGRRHEPDAGRSSTMKLYFSPGACSLSPHIVIREAGIEADLEQVDLKTKKTKSGADFTAVNPKDQVPTLVLDSGKTLTEGPAIVQYLADQKPQSGLAPQNGTFERYRLQEWLKVQQALREERLII